MRASGRSPVSVSSTTSALNATTASHLPVDDLAGSRRRHQQRLERLRARARRPSCRARPPCRPSPRRTVRSRRRGTARARRIAAASRDRRASTRSGLATRRRDAAQHQPLIAPQPVVAAQQRLGLLDRRRARDRASGRTRAARCRACPARRRRAKRSSIDQHDVEVAARGSARRSRPAPSMTVTCWRSRKAMSAGAYSAPTTGKLELARALRLARDQVEDQQQEDRAGGDRRDEASPCRCDDRGTCRATPCAGSRASCCEAADVRWPASSSCGEAFVGADQRDERVFEAARAGTRDQLRRRCPAATTRPCARTTMRSHSAATSCITCDENSRHLPCARSARNSSRKRAHAHDVEPVRRLVEQDRVGIVDQRAGDRDLHLLALRKARPSAARRVAAKPSVANSASIRASSAAPARPCSAPK